MRKWLVTGGSGFIGTNLIENLLNDNIELINIDNVKPRLKKHLPYWKNIDILQLADLEKEICGFEPQIIIHLASVTDLNGKTLSYYKSNIEGTKNLIDVASKVRSLQKIVFTSSMYVCRPGFVPNDFDTYQPHTIYGQSKVEGEKLVKSLGNTHYDWVIIRPTSIWGPWFNIPYIDFFKVVYEHKYFDFGKTCTKTYGYIGNTIHQIIQLANSNQVNRKIFYVGDQPPIQISEWANEISLQMQKGKIKKIPYPVIKIAAGIGDILKSFNVSFPITGSRLSNMMTNNILPLDDLYAVTGPPTFTRLEGVKETLLWLKEFKGYDNL